MPTSPPEPEFVLLAELLRERVRGLMFPGWDETLAYRNFCEGQSPILVVGGQAPALVRSLASSGADLVLVDPEPERYGLTDPTSGPGSVEFARIPLFDYDLLRRFPRAILPMSALFRAQDRAEMVRILRAARHHLAPYGQVYLSGFAAPEGLSEARTELSEQRIPLPTGTFSVRVQTTWDPARRRTQVFQAMELVSEQEARSPRTLSWSQVHNYVRPEHLLPLLNSAGLRCQSVMTNESGRWAFEGMLRKRE